MEFFTILIHEPEVYFKCSARIRSVDSRGVEIKIGLEF
jgi:hypothetical protein